MLLAGSDEPGQTTSGDGFGFTSEGQKMLRNAVDYMLGLESRRASNPYPHRATVDVTGVRLSWTPGLFAQSHDVYFGTVPSDVSMATLDDPRGILVSMGQDAAAHDPGPLNYSTTYYWRIDEVNADSTVTKGWVWRFRTEFELEM